VAKSKKNKKRCHNASDKGECPFVKLAFAGMAVMFLSLLLVGCVTQNIGKNKKNTDNLSQQTQIPDSTRADSTLTPDLQTNLPDSTGLADSIANLLQDTLTSDSLTLQTPIPDSTEQIETLPISPNAVTSVVEYFAQDSVEFDIKNKKALLFEKTKLLYEDIELEAYSVTIDFSKNELHAEGIADTTEKLHGSPVFKQSSYEFKCHELDYNFASKKGLIKNVIMQEGEGYLHGQIVKKNADNTNFICKGKYTTCNLEHPHFEIAFGKAKVVPSDKIITGPLHVRIANIPTFLALPFGFFPNSNKRTNGLLPPGPGFHSTLGHYLKGGGYYFAIKDVMDFSITTDIYMQAAFGINVSSRYVKRYKCSGNVTVNYTLTPKDDEQIYKKPSETDDKKKKTDTSRFLHNFIINWTYIQDRKAHPIHNFSANVDFQTSGFRKNSANVTYDELTKAVTNSTVSFSTSFKSRYTLGINANINQNLSTSALALDLPQINFNVQQFYPLRKKKTTRKRRWYEEISMQYTANMRNSIHTTDTMLFKQPAEAFKSFNSELSHTIPIKSTIKILKYISWNNSVSFNEIWQLKAYDRSWGRDTTKEDTTRLYGIINIDTNYGFFPTHNLSYNSDFSTTLYGMYINKRTKGRVYAIRHSFTPSAGFTFTPAINKHLYRFYYDSAKLDTIFYSIATTNPIQKHSAKVNIAFNNRLEMKVRKKSKEDEDEDFKKVVLLERFSINTAYDFIRDSLRLDPIRISGGTRLFKYIDLNFDISLDPYAYDDSLGKRTNTFEWNASRSRRHAYYDNSGTLINVVEYNKYRSLFRLASTGWGVGCGLTLNKDFFKPKKEKDKETAEIPTYGFKDWNVTINYTFYYNLADNPFHYNRYLRMMDTVVLKYTHTFNNTLNINGRIAITSKWALGFRSGYDFTNKRISVSEFTIERDLHCWQMHFKWIPIGPSRYFEFLINAKANILKDVKLKQELRFTD